MNSYAYGVSGVSLFNRKRKLGGENEGQVRDLLYIE